MFKPNPKNERIKHKYFEWQKEANGRSGSTVLAVEKAICLFEQYTKGTDFATFNSDKAVGFKKWVVQSKRGEGPIALSTLNGYTIHLKQFFKWLSQQPGYKSRFTPDMASYFNLSTKDERMARETTPRSFPSLEHVLKLTDSIVIRNEIDLRDRGLISFTLLSGMRDRAIVTLPLGCFDRQRLRVDQDPRKGVETKFTKVNRSTLFPFDEKLLGHFLQWHERLVEKRFKTQDPLFPRSKSDQGKEGLSFESAREVEPIFWKGTGRIREIFKKRSRDAGLPYFPPHAYRHLAADLAITSCRTGEQIKAVSENLGHEYVATTLSAYGTLGPERLSQVVGTLRRPDLASETEEGKLEKLKKFVSTL